VEEVRAKTDCTVICTICGRVQDLKAGDVIPYCCGKLMEIDE